MRLMFSQFLNIKYNQPTDTKNGYNDIKNINAEPTKLSGMKAQINPSQSHHKVNQCPDGFHMLCSVLEG
jgi:hypothetical protein